MRYFYISVLTFFLASGVSAQTINTVAGNGGNAYSGNGGQATAASLSDPEDARPDAAGNFFTSEFTNYVTRKITAAGVMNAYAGNNVAAFAGDGGQATAAEIDWSYGVAVDALGNVYCCDFYGQRIRKVNAAGVISTVAGNGTGGFSGDGGQATAAEINGPASLAVDVNNNVYIGDWYNNVIRKITVATGKISTVAGTNVAGYNGDGIQATAAQLQDPEGVAVDAAGNIYIADTYNYRIRKVAASTGLISTVVGTGASGYNGDNIQATTAQLSFPRGVCVNTAGDLYIADQSQSRIRKVAVGTGIITTYAGNGVGGFFGDGGPATAAEFSSPCKAQVDAAGNVYIADLFNQRIRKIGNVPLPITLLDFTGVYENSAVNLDWATAVEINNKYFDIERSLDGVNFTELAQVNGAGNSSQTNYYTTVDEHPAPGLNYYRLKQTDYDGHATYFKVVAVDVTANSFTVFPNPAKAIVNVEYTANQSETGTSVIKIYSLMGSLVATRQVNLLAGANTFQVDVSALSNGLYLLVFNNGTKQFTGKLVVNNSQK